MDATEKLAKKIEEKNEGYTCKALPDGSVACMFDLVFTRAIVLGVNELSYTKRFCFESKRLAAVRFMQLDSQDDEPEGYLARREGGPKFRAVHYSGDEYAEQQSSTRED